jgi:hypothetical protein
MANLVFADYGPGPENNLIMDPNDLSYYKTYILEQSAVPVMIAQSCFINGGGAIPSGLSTGQTTSLSATSGSVTMTFGGAILAGNSTDVGKQITFIDGTTFRSALITAFGTTTTCTATLASTASGVGPFATGTFIGNPLPTNYTGGIWVYLPAGAVSGGLAGFYWCAATQTATANGILQVTTTFTATMGVPYIPRGPVVNAVGSGSNFTGVTTQQTLASAVVPGGAMGANGALRSTAQVSVPNTANTKTFRQRLGSGDVAGWSVGGPSAFIRDQRTVTNRGAQNIQSIYYDGIYGFGSLTGAATQITVDTSVSQNYTLGGNIVNSTDFCILENFTLEILPRA